ncbi:MAG: hypothetical protein JNM69_16540 [Archangium sp.]|nr:hypothetical protein [Archangium sp.]
MTRWLLCMTCCLASLAWSAEAFPWNGSTTLTTDVGQTLTWTVTRVEGEVHITGKHPRWSVDHVAKPDGTPLRTVRHAAGAVTRVTYSSDGAVVERVEANGTKRSVTITKKGLWDGDTLDVRLAGIPWRDGKKLRVSVIDVEKADGTVYPLVAVGQGEDRCNRIPCQRVHVELDDLRSLFAPSYEYRFAMTPDARFLGFEGDGFTFAAR